MPVNPALAVTVPAGVSVLGPALRLSNTCVKLVVVSPVAKLPKVIVGAPVELVVPSYCFVSDAAVTVMGRLLIVPVAVLKV